ncbi:14196_t:CDS:2 [Rhizophagus irregularis]|nr:14196_t:CDS:2 [Rhizophagus irregularis]
MANPIETIVQAYVAAVTSQPNNERRDIVDISASQLESSSSSNVNNIVQPTIQSYSNRSFFRRAWDKVESKPPVHKRRLSQHSEELISAGPSDYSPRSSSEWPTRQTYEDWQRDQGELDIEELKVKDLIAGWAMGEGRPWFD